MLEISADFSTSKGKYRIALYWITEDNTDEDNLGITSLYIINYYENPFQEHAYWGDTLWTLGINIGTIRKEPYPGE